MRGALVRNALVEHRRALVGAFASALGVGLATVGLAGTSAWLIVRAAQEPAVLSLTVPMGLVQLFALAKAAGRYLERNMTHSAVLSVMSRVRHDVARTVEPLAPAGLGPRSAEVVDLAVRDVESVEDLLASVAGPFGAAAATGLVTALVCGLVVGPTGLVLLGALLCELGLVPWMLRRPLRRADEHLDATRRTLGDLVAEVSAGWEEYAMGGAGEVVRARLAALEDDYDAAERARRRGRALAEALIIALTSLSVMAVLGLTSTARGSGLNPALVAVPVLLSLSALDLVAAATSGLLDSGPQRTALQRFDALASRPWPVRDPSTSLGAPLSDASLDLSRVSLAFDRAVLSELELHVRSGETIVLRGPSGAGKSTLAHVIARFIAPDSGHVLLAEVDYERLRGADVRERIGFSETSPYVFSSTLAANLRLGRANASDDELRAAIHDAGLDDWFASLPEGLATPLGGARSGLSGGEQRRLGIAREYVSARHVLVLDEPTEGLDELSAHVVLERLAQRQHGGMTLAISHRARDASVATRVLRLEGGRLEPEAGVLDVEEDR